MNDFTLEELKNLASQEGEPKVSIYLPRSREVQETDQNRIRLKNLLDQAEERLISRGLRSPEAKKLLQPARELYNEGDVRQPYGAEGLAVLLDTDSFRTHRLGFACPEILYTGKRYYISPLAHEWARAEGDFYLLALSAKSVRLYLCSADNLQPVPLPPKMPTSMEEALAGTEVDRSLQSRTFGATTPAGSPSDRVEMIHGHGAPKDEEKKLLMDYFVIITRHLDGALSGKRLPLVLAAVDYYHPMFRSTFRYPHIVAEGVKGSPDEQTEKELLQRAMPLVKPCFRQEFRKAVGRYEQNISTERTSNDLAAILSAAEMGRVDCLFATLGAQAWGKLHSENGEPKPEFHETEQPDDDDLLDRAVAQTICHGGTAYVVDRREVPGNEVAAALFRW